MKTVLLIDDEDNVREVAQLSLELMAGWKVRTARNGLEGIALAIEDRPDAILLDVMMPDLDGPDTFERLRADARTAQIPVIFLTAKAQAAELSRLAALGVNAVMTKPFDPMRLAAQIAGALGWNDPAI